MTSRKPTSRQLQALRFIARRCNDGLPPTVAELADHMGYATRSNFMLVALSKLDLIEWHRGVARGIRPTALGERIAGVESRASLLEDVYRAADRWERGDGGVTALLDAVWAVREHDGALEAAREVA